MRSKPLAVFICLAGVSLLGVLFLAALPGAAAPAAPLVVIASGLNNPRGLAMAGDGTLYVAEAGNGGDGPCVPAGLGNPHCYGPTGSITRIDTNGDQERIVTGLPSIADQTFTAPQAPGDEALGRTILCWTMGAI
jgi:hypothetical protein